MKKLFLWVAAILVSMGAYSQEMNKSIMDERTGGQLLIGTVDRDGLTANGVWFTEGYNAYTPDAAVIDKLKEYADRYPHITTILGTWCGDSREHVPHLYKVLDLIDYPQEKHTVISVDRAKKAEGMDLENYKITYIPLFLVTTPCGKELGRIVETPAETIEKDLLKIFTDACVH